MSSENEPYGHEWLQRQLNIFQEEINNRKTYTEQVEEGKEKIKHVLQDIHEKHPNMPEIVSPIKPVEEVYDEKKSKKDIFPKLWDYEGKDGVHDLMQRRYPQNIRAPIAQNIIPEQEIKDWRKLHPKRNGWGKYHNMTRKEFSEYFLQECTKNIEVLKVWIELYPNDPKSEYLKNTLFKK